MSLMVVMHEAAIEAAAAHACARAEARSTAAYGEYAGRVVDLARRTGKTV